jgi:hypothetical protein
VIIWRAYRKGRAGARLGFEYHAVVAMFRSLLAGCLLVLCAVAGVRAHDEFGFVGTLTRVDLARKQIAVKFKENGKDETVRIVLVPSTQITKDKQKVPVSTLKTGLSVVIRALGDDYSNLEAVQIRIVPPLPARK